MKNCALIWLPFNEPSMPPLGIAVITGYLRNKGFDVDPFDLNVEFYSEMKNFFKNQPSKIVNMFNSWAYNDIFQQAAASLGFPDQIDPPGFLLWEKRSVYINLESFLLSAAEKTVSQYDIVGFSVTNVNFMASVAMSKLIKSMSPETCIVWGGPSVRPGQCFEKLERLGCVDQFVSGPGEGVLENILSSESDPFVLKKKNIIIPDCPEKLSSRDCPDFSSFPLQRYDQLTFPVQASTGCPWSKCAFCSEHDLSYSEAPMDYIDHCLDRIVSSSKDKVSLFFVDSCINWDLNRLDTICTLLKSKKQVKWTCMARSENLTPHILKKMKKAGCQRVFIGLESFSNATLAAMQKGCSQLDHLHAFRIGREHEIKLAGNFIIGFPGETIEDVLENIRILQKYDHLWVNCSFWLSPYTVTPGSKIFKKPDHYNISVKDYGDETQCLPETVSLYVPVWNHHWTCQKADKNNNKRLFQLYHQLEFCIQKLQQNQSTKKYAKPTWKGMMVFEETPNGQIRTKQSINRLEKTILTLSSEIINVTHLKNKMGISFSQLRPVLEKMVRKGWIAQSNARIVRTLPFKQMPFK